MDSVTVTGKQEPVLARRTWLETTVTSALRTIGTTVRTEAVSPVTVTHNTLWVLTATW